MAEQRPDFSERERPVAAPLSDNQSEPPHPRERSSHYFSRRRAEVSGREKATSMARNRSVNNKNREEENGPPPD